MRTGVIGDGEAADQAVAEDRSRTSVVVDLTHSAPFEDAVLEFFEISTAYIGDVEHSFRLMSDAR